MNIWNKIYLKIFTLTCYLIILKLFIRMVNFKGSSKAYIKKENEYMVI